MKSPRNLGPLIGIVLLPSAVLYLLHYVIFRDVRNVAFYTVMDLAFLPIQAILVSTVLEAFISRHEAAGRIKKLGMVSGAFFSEVGDGLLGLLSAREDSIEKRRKMLAVGSTWSKGDFESAAKASGKLAIGFTLNANDFSELSAYLGSRRDFLLRLLENPLLLDHEFLTDALMAVFHAHDELRQRTDFENLPASDTTHLTKDLERAYASLIDARLMYLAALKSGYPFLFSLALRSDPLSSKHDPLVLE